MITKKTQRLGDATIQKIVNVRAMYKLSKAVDGKVYGVKLPSIDDMLDEFVNEVMDEVEGCGDDVRDVELDDGAQSEDDEEYEIMDPNGPG